MLLIRNLGQEQYARQINQGVIGCRDLLSHLFCKTDNKYPYADFYEALFSQVRRRFHLIDPHFAVDETICGKNETAYYCGSRLRYVEKAKDINVRETNMACPGIATAFADSETYGCCPDINEQTIYTLILWLHLHRL